MAAGPLPVHAVQQMHRVAELRRNDDAPDTLIYLKTGGLHRSAFPNLGHGEHFVARSKDQMRLRLPFFPRHLGKP